MKEVKKLGKQWLEFETWAERIAALDLPYYAEPKTDNDRLINAQYRFLTSEMKDQVAEAELWQGTYDMSMNLIKSEMRRKNLHYDEDEIDIKAGIASLYVMRRYRIHLNDYNEIYVIRNFVCQMQKAVWHALYHEEENDFLLDSAVDLETADRYINGSEEKQ